MKKKKTVDPTVMMHIDNGQQLLPLRPQLQKEMDKSKDGKLTKKFCQSFLKYLPTDEKVMKVMDFDYVRDSVDYYAWGYSLTGKWINGEEMVRELEIWEAIEEYKL